MTEHDQKIVWKKSTEEFGPNMFQIGTTDFDRFYLKCQSVWVANSKEIHSCGDMGYLEV